MPGLPDPALGELHGQFVRAILHRDLAGVAGRIRVGGLSVERRLAIYRTNARENFAVALAAAYPLLHRCLGPEEFRELAWTYQRACPSPSGNLFHLGERLAGFLAAHVSGTGRAYLADVARLEWAIQESLVAGDDPGVPDLPALAAVPGAALPGVRCRLHPSVRLLPAAHGVFALWQALQSGDALPGPAPGPEHLLILRRADGVVVHRLPAADFAWLGCVRQGGTLGEALAGLPVEQQAGLGDLLVRVVGTGAITAFN